MERGRGITDNSISVKYAANNYEFIYRCMLAGLTERQMSEVLSVSPSAITYNKTHNPEFMEAFQKGKVIADMRVAESLYKMCFDHYADEDVEEIHIVNKVAEVHRRKLLIPADKVAALKWLAARQPEQWRESQTMNINKVNTNINIDLTGFSIEDAKQLEQLGYKQLPEHKGINE